MNFCDFETRDPSQLRPLSCVRQEGIFRHRREQTIFSVYNGVRSPILKFYSLARGVGVVVVVVVGGVIILDC